MALCEAASSLRAARLRPLFSPVTASLQVRRNATAVAAPPVDDLEPASSFDASSPSEHLVKKFDPAAWSRSRVKQLPPSRYRFRPPKYYRGPLHPHQPPPESDPSSRAFHAGPFMLTRLEQTYESTIASDFMTLTYQHFPPGYKSPDKSQRLREWIGDSPYFKNRPLRGPRGGDVLLPRRKPITFRNVPQVTGVTVHSFISEANDDSAHLHVASMVLQSITNVRCETHQAKKSVVQWGHKKGKFVSLTAKLGREDAYNFLSKTTDIVMARIKDYRGVAGSAGDSAGNISFGFSPEQVAFYPEVEFNYDMYPAKMIPGCNITIHTTAKTDRDARLLLEAFGIPFYGKHVN